MNQTKAVKKYVKFHSPNAETLAAMLESEAGQNLYEAKDIDDLFRQCGIVLEECDDEQKPDN